MKQGRCLTARELADAVRGTLSGDALQHLHSCRACGKRTALLRRIDATGVHRIKAATDEAEARIAKLLLLPRNKWWQTLRAPEYQHPEIVHRLLALADDAGLRDRKLAVALVTAATRIVDTLPADAQDLNDLRFEAWKLASALLREAGKYEHTEQALARAEVAARAASDPKLAEATVLFYRALLFAEPDVWRPEEARELLDRIESIFQIDAARQQAMRAARALLLSRSGDFGAALPIFREILATTPSTARESWLNALSNVMSARVDLGDASDEVAIKLKLLIDENVALGRTVQVARAHWLMGRVRRARGEHEESAQLLQIAMRDIGDSDSAVRIGLDRLETLLLAERYDEAMALARELSKEAVALDQREPSRRRSLTAAVFAYAREAAQRGALTADLVSQLSRYLDRINRQRPIAFIPPMPLADM